MRVDKIFIEQHGYSKTMELIQRKILLLSYDNKISIRKNALKLGIDRNTLTRYVKQYGLCRIRREELE